MTEFLHGWRRKAGCVTLFLACVLMGGWVRSKVTGDGFHFDRGPADAVALESFNGSLLWVTSHESNVRAIAPNWWQTFPVSDYEHLNDPIYDLEFRFVGFGIGHFGDGNDQLWIYVAPYWAIVIPLTLIAMWLLRIRSQPGTDALLQQKVTVSDRVVNLEIDAPQ